MTALQTNSNSFPSKIFAQNVMYWIPTSNEVNRVNFYEINNQVNQIYSLNRWAVANSWMQLKLYGICAAPRFDLLTHKLYRKVASQISHTRLCRTFHFRLSSLSRLSPTSARKQTALEWYVRYAKRSSIWCIYVIIGVYCELYDTTERLFKVITKICLEHNLRFNLMLFLQRDNTSNAM